MVYLEFSQKHKKFIISTHRSVLLINHIICERTKFDHYLRVKPSGRLSTLSVFRFFLFSCRLHSSLPLGSFLVREVKIPLFSMYSFLIAAHIISFSYGLGKAICLLFWKVIWFMLVTYVELSWPGCSAPDNSCSVEGQFGRTKFQPAWFSSYHIRYVKQ